MRVAPPFKQLTDKSFDVDLGAGCGARLVLGSRIHRRGLGRNRPGLACLGPQEGEVNGQLENSGEEGWLGSKDDV